MSAKSALDQAEDGLGRGGLLSLSQCFHGAANQNELLLEIVEADHAVNLVPVVNAGLK